MTVYARLCLAALGLSLVTPFLVSDPVQARDGTVRLGLASLPPNNGNPFTSTARTSWYTWRATFDTLTQLGADLSVQPGLAESWENIDESTWIFHLRPGVTFSNGEPFDAETVKFVFRYLKTDATAQDSIARDVTNVAGIEAVDSHTIKFTTVEPDPLFPRQMMIIPMVPPAYWQEVGRDGFTFAPIGTGPFAVTAWQETRVAFEAFDGSWRAPKVAALEILALPETASRLQALQADRIDIASELGPDDIDTLEMAGLTHYQRPATAIEVIAFNTMVESPLQDVRVRQALNYAVNKPAIGVAIMGGLVDPAGQPTPDINPERNPDIAPYPYDPERAKVLLAEAGYPDGFSFVFEFSYGTGGTHMASMFQQIAADLARIGVDMEVRPLPWSQFVRGVLQGEWGGQAFGFEYETLPTGASMRPFRLHSCNWSYPWYCDESIMPDIADAKQLFDETARIAAVRTVLAHYHDQAASLFLFPNIGLDGLNPRVTGYNQDGGIIPFHAIGLDGPAS